jgi:hypothetical protein
MEIFNDEAFTMSFICTKSIAGGLIDWKKERDLRTNRNENNSGVSNEPEINRTRLVNNRWV